MIRWRGCDLPHRIFYGWYVVGAIALVLTTTSGLGFYNLSVLLDAFVRERGFPVALASGATACCFVGSGVGGVLAGWLIDRLDRRIVVIVSTVLSALLIACLGILYRRSSFICSICSLASATAAAAPSQTSRRWRVGSKRAGRSRSRSPRPGSRWAASSSRRSPPI
jgi:MFS family permease